VLTVALLVPAVVMCVLGWVFLRSARRARGAGAAFLRDAVTARADVVDVREKYRPRAESDSMPSYFPVVVFTLPDGRVVESEVMVGARPAPARVGDRVEVRYDPVDPRRVTLARGLASLGAAGCFATGLAVALWLVGGFLAALWVLLVLVLKVPA
jgi:Protein of unknown function (DUF3592)